MIPYIGGKSYLAGWIISQFPVDYKTRTYCEVFGGGGWVLFKKEQSHVEIYNDLNKNLVNLFKVIRDNYPEFEHRAQWSLHSREMFNEAIKKLKDDKFLSAVEKALHFALYRIQTFSGSNNKSWGYQVTGDKIASGRWRPFLSRIAMINARLKRVQIECLDFEKVISKYDSANTLFYLDPPYVGVEHYYATKDVQFWIKDHERLADTLKNIKGKFLLSYYPHPLINKLYRGYKRKRKRTIKHSSGCVLSRKHIPRPKATELLISNY